ncbi:dolichol kinase [Cryptococcus bacillisporus CA1873]|uniref:dolichol kinase n=1 Tax=Cryptococcus bacillisporus CA1873 TaxID=1296111 RepID=A0ABR5B8I2_CRYGA|nr:dolichol kinase [Cryptococcus bacillisporus CA1873]|eukprot:KIR59719.1 dolichol kinase [Cryptococcus gattii CA1873]
MAAQSSRPHHHRVRPRSHSRSSSSPSPPPSPLQHNHIHPHSSPRGSPSSPHSVRDVREKRRSFNVNRTSVLSAGGHRTRALSRGALPVFPNTDDRRPNPVDENAVVVDTDGVGFSTQYGASASSMTGVSGSEQEFLSGLRDETETEVESDRKDTTQWRRSVDDPLDRAPTPLALNNPRHTISSRRPVLQTAPPFTLLPFRLRFSGHSVSIKFGWKSQERIWNLSIKMTRRGCENALVLGAVLWGIWVLVVRWNEKAVAGEIGLLVGLTLLYTALRFQPTPQRLLSQPPPTNRPTSPAFAPPNWGSSFARERIRRTSISNSNGSLSPSFPKDYLRGRAFSPDEDGRMGIGERASIWGTEEREYRECPDDGIFYSLLLGPLVAAALLHSALSQLSSNPSSPVAKGWNIESPLVLPSTPIRRGASISDAEPTDTIRALSALATSRRNLVQLFTLCSFVLLVHVTRSLHLEITQFRINYPPNSTSPDAEVTKLHSLQAQQANIGAYWLRKGEWKRTRSVVGFSFLVTGVCLLVKAVTAKVGRGVWSDMSPSDIVIATLFYQFSIYVCVRLARRGVTLGELAAVCNAATAMVMETTNLTRMKISIFRTPYIKTYRLPTPLLIFQLALIPGSLLAGFLLSPLLYLSRNLAQKPAHRLRLPHEKPVHRRLLALGFYAGSVLICGGLIGVWTKWCLGGRNPFTWAFFFIFEGTHAWTRPALIAYWVALAAISVAGWERQLNRARKHRRYVVPGTAAIRGEGPGGQHSVAGGPAGKPLGLGSGNVLGIATNGGQPGGTTQEGFTGVATQMMDAADQRMPTLSVNARRKSFHALAVIMFIPGIAVDPAFTHLSFSVAFAAFNFVEYVRYFALWPFGVKVHLFLNEFLDHKDSGTAILSHFYLLAGCAAPLWFEGSSDILSYFGVLSLGIGDALASIVGRRIGRLRWCSVFGKTVEGSVAFFFSVLGASWIMWLFGIVDDFNFKPYTITVALATLLEAFSAQNDNLILPMFGWAVGTLLGV